MNMVVCVKQIPDPVLMRYGVGQQLPPLTILRRFALHKHQCILVSILFICF